MHPLPVCGTRSGPAVAPARLPVCGTVGGPAAAPSRAPLRHPEYFETNAVDHLRRVIWRLGHRPDVKLQWSPDWGRYVLVVPYNSRLSPRLPKFINSNDLPYSNREPWNVQLLPYGVAVPVVEVVEPPGFVKPEHEVLFAGAPRLTLRDGTGYGFPQVMVGPAPSIDGVAYLTDSQGTCQPVQDPGAWASTLNFPQVQPSCPQNPASSASWPGAFAG